MSSRSADGTSVQSCANPSRGACQSNIPHVLDLTALAALVPHVTTGTGT
jgi:hypothetical protein